VNLSPSALAGYEDEGGGDGEGKGEGSSGKWLWECLTACKALSHANAKGTGTNNWVIRSLD